VQQCVWASAWSLKAFEERDWYGIPHENAAMGVLVNERSKDELVDIVAFSGDPTAPNDHRFLIDAQADGGSGGARARILARNDAPAGRGRHGDQHRAPALIEHATARASGVVRRSPARAGSLVLGGAQGVPQDDPTPAERTVLFDSEWKILGDGRLIIKQIRPR